VNPALKLSCPRKEKNVMTQQQATQSTAKDLPKTGQTYRCDKCGMEVKVTRDCQCQEGSPLLACCGEQMTKA
jgi:hypothetical protein